MAVVFEGVDHKVQRLYIHWDITTVCNFDCSYCYAKKEYSQNKLWLKEDTVENIKTVIKAISISTLPVFLGLLGGEPTLSKHFEFILNEFKRTHFFEKEDNKLYITTNGSKELCWFINQHSSDFYNNKVMWLFSWHSEHMSNDSNKEFKEKIEVLLNKGYKVKVNLMIPLTKEKWADLKELSLELIQLQKEFADLILHPHFIYKNEHQIYNYPEDTKLYFKEIFENIPKEFQMTRMTRMTLLNDIEVFETGLNNFNGWYCYLNNYEINLGAIVSKFCVQEIADLKNNITFFKKIKKVIPVICEHNQCSCDGLLKIRKEKDT